MVLLFKPEGILPDKALGSDPGEAFVSTNIIARNSVTLTRIVFLGNPSQLADRVVIQGQSDGIWLSIIQRDISNPMNKLSNLCGLLYKIPITSCFPFKHVVQCELFEFVERDIQIRHRIRRDRREWDESKMGCSDRLIEIVV
jgi:hypothetical protein